MTQSFITNIAIFASGAGTNAANIIHHFSNHVSVKIALVVCNNPNAGVLKIAQDNRIPSLLIEKEKFFTGNAYLPELKNHDINFIVLAGFLWKLPLALIQAYPQKIINIHPALLPKYGGKGMYGNFVHEAVLLAKEKESGITIHFVDEVYDNGKTIFQVICPVYENDTAASLSKRIHELEYRYFPEVIEGVVQGNYED